MSGKSEKSPESVATDTPIEPGSLVPVGIDVSTEQGIAQELALFTDATIGLNASGKMHKLPVEALKLHPDNPREELDTDGMCASYRHRGYVAGAPLTISKRANGDLFVLRGNRRTAAAQWLQTNEPETFKKVFPSGNINCVVLTGLTLADEIGLLIDHGKEQDRRSLSKREELTAMRKLIQAGIKGRDAIARALDLVTRTKDEKTGRMVEKVRGPYVQPRLALLSLPVEIQTAYLNSTMFGGEDARMQQKQIMTSESKDKPALSVCLAEDRKAGNIGADGFGPKLRARWTEILNTPVDAKSTVDRYIAESKASALLAGCKSRAAQNVINVLAGFNQKDKLADIDAAIVATESAEVMLSQIAACIGPVEFAELCDRAEKHAKATAVVPAVPAAGADHAEESEESEVDEAAEVTA